MKNFKNGEKNQFRRTQWKRIAERVPPSMKRDGVILYLAGDRALDEIVAVSHGFKTKNMIAVERDPKVVAALRAQGQTVIAGDLVDTLAYWNSSRPIAAVVGDFFCGLEADLVNKLRLIVGTQVLKDSVIAVNFLRGRDPSSRHLRAGAEQYLKHYQPGKEKHRGWQFFVYLVHHFAVPYADRFLPDQGLRRRAYNIFCDFCDQFAEAKPYEYKSGPQVFDSIVFKNVIYEYLDALNLGLRVDTIRPVFDRRQQGRTAAALAHRTRRLTA